jgi:hypothetical protein
MRASPARSTGRPRRGGRGRARNGRPPWSAQAAGGTVSRSHAWPRAGSKARSGRGSFREASRVMRLPRTPDYVWELQLEWRAHDDCTDRGSARSRLSAPSLPVTRSGPTGSDELDVSLTSMPAGFGGRCWWFDFPIAKPHCGPLPTLSWSYGKPLDLDCQVADLALDLHGRHQPQAFLD